jgi:hypothetical protein
MLEVNTVPSDFLRTAKEISSQFISKCMKGDVTEVLAGEMTPARHASGGNTPFFRMKQP